MSTKATIEHGENFHFYAECFVDHLVYLNVNDDDLEFVTWPKNVTVGIKAEDMDKIAKAWLEYRKKEVV
jgi:hypothetical protein